ncbi:ABC transporter ATP-binding protein [Treponema endosymbiont of Eucomonympha sp.]|uniref:ABC transporter ATP-binding protein n=2 Tax=Treponema endosymbiont of Eucomonympha sp. TaxID=1580831 RepID=UPI000AFF225C|nr:ATP-binding cassette domain-containing protein [Treponema endosymbiont of Eucomonympha sp.]
MTPVIQVQNLTKRYKNTPKNSVDNISFTVNEGEFFAFLGANGAGKTTTISILTTTLGKTSGDVAVAGYDIDADAKNVRSHIGIIFQKPSLDLDLSAEENIRLHVCMYGMYGYRPFFKWMPKAYQEQVVKLAEIMGIRDSLRKPLKTHSGGMRRKIEIIRSLMHRPAVLFLDEPSQGLDAVSRRSLWEYIDQIRTEYGTTVFLTTHYIDEAENVDRLCMINKGNIIFSGTPSELKSERNQKSLEDAYINLLTDDVVLPYSADERWNRPKEERRE